MSKTRRILSEARALHGAGRLTEAEQLYRKLLRKAPRDGEVWYGLGTLFLQKGDAAAAIEPLERATRLLPSNAQCHLNLGDFDPIASDFHLKVLSAYVDKAAIR